MALAKQAQTSNLDGFRISQDELKDLLKADDSMVVDEYMEDSNDLAVEMELTPDAEEKKVLESGAEVIGEIEIQDSDGEVIEEKEFEFKLDAVPGGEDQSEIVEEQEPEEIVEEDKDPWKCTPEKFLDWAKDRLANIPKHNGKSVAGLVRAKSYLEKFLPVIKSALQSDVDGFLDTDQVEAIRDEVLQGIERLEDRIQKIEAQKRPKSKKKKADEEYGLVKEAQKAAGFTVVVPLLHSFIARTVINSHVSGGHDIEDSFIKMAKKYDLDKREIAEMTQLILDMGYPLNLDRGRLGEDVDKSSSNNFDWAANYLK
jgi:hypothetical protein